MLMYALLGVLLIVIGLALKIRTMPDTMSLSRSAVIPAAPGVVFARLQDFREWGAWSPWEKLDPNLNRSYSGAASGVGSVYEWSGNKKVGRGRMEILESTPPARLVIKLDFLAPWEAHNMTTFTLSPEAGGTRVTWGMSGPNTTMGKVMGLFMNMDKMVGGDFEKGLTGLANAVR